MKAEEVKKWKPDLYDRQKWLCNTAYHILCEKKMAGEAKPASLARGHGQLVSLKRPPEDPNFPCPACGRLPKVVEHHTISKTQWGLWVGSHLHKDSVCHQCHIERSTAKRYVAKRKWLEATRERDGWTGTIKKTAQRPPKGAMDMMLLSESARGSSTHDKHVKYAA